MHQRGNNVILSVGMMFISIMFGAFAIDLGSYYAIQTQMQTAADSAALAGPQELFKVETSDPGERGVHSVSTIQLIH